MLVSVKIQNTFLTLDEFPSWLPKRRCHSEELVCMDDSRSADLERVVVLQEVLKSAEGRFHGVSDLHDWLHETSQNFVVNQTDTALDSRPMECHSLVRSLRKIGPNLSSNSVSTMAPSDDEGEVEDDDTDGMETTDCATWRVQFSNSPRSSVSDSDICDEVSNLGQPMGQPKVSKHCLVPKNVNLAQQYAQSKRDGKPVTTVMIRNIPNRFSQRALVNELEHAGLHGCFDFLYIPLDLGTMSNVGYAFVNFTHPAFAARCMEILPIHPFSHRKAGKNVSVSVAHIQGLEANLRHYEKSAVNASRLRQRRPVVMNVLKAVSLADSI